MRPGDLLVKVVENKASQGTYLKTGVYFSSSLCSAGVYLSSSLCVPLCVFCLVCILVLLCVFSLVCILVPLLCVQPANIS